MRRRASIVLMCAIAAWPQGSLTQPRGKIRRVGYIGGSSYWSSANPRRGFLLGMNELGYTEGKDFVVDWRYAEGLYERFPAIATELVRSKVDVFVLGTQAAVRPVRQITSTIPIVMAYSTDPVANGFVASLAHPGGNVTGLASSHDDIIPKQIELIALVVPRLARFGLLTNPDNPNSGPAVRSAQTVARKANFALLLASARNPEELNTAWATLAAERANAVIVIPDAFFFFQRDQLARLGIDHRLPTIFPNRDYTDRGGLMSYGESLFEFNRRAAFYVDKIFRGANAGELPIQLPTTFELIINLKTAKALAITIPQSVLMRAAEVIQ
jgi:putative ABC transport system substrate-binding protein